MFSLPCRNTFRPWRLDARPGRLGAGTSSTRRWFTRLKWKAEMSHASNSMCSHLRPRGHNPPECPGYLHSDRHHLLQRGGEVKRPELMVKRVSSMLTQFPAAAFSLLHVLPALVDFESLFSLFGVRKCQVDRFMSQSPRACRVWFCCSML